MYLMKIMIWNFKYLKLQYTLDCIPSFHRLTHSLTHDYFTHTVCLLSAGCCECGQKCKPG